MKKLSLISHYYNSHEKAQDLIDYLAQAKPETLEHLELVIVDDCSNEERQLSAPNFSLKYLRIIDDIPWNQAGARNLGALTSEGRWQLFRYRSADFLRWIRLCGRALRWPCRYGNALFFGE